MILIYEIIKEAQQAKNVDEALKVLKKYDTETLEQVLHYTYHPKAQWYIDEFPADFHKPDTYPGISYTNLYTELRRIYLFQKGHPSADNLTEKRRHELLLQILESMEPPEAHVFVNIMKGDLGIKGITWQKINEYFPNLIT
jgi:hypothetical protein